MSDPASVFDARRKGVKPVVGRLPDKCIEFLKMLSWGYDDDEIASELGISRYSISNYVVRATEYYEAHNRTHAVAMAIRKGDIK